MMPSGQNVTGIFASDLSIEEVQQLHAKQASFIHYP